MSEPASTGEVEAIREQIAQALHEVVDPEVGVNIVDLGLVYRVDVRGSRVDVIMTMTTPACPLHSYISENVKEAIRRHAPQITDVDVELVWDPPWSPEMMSAAARCQLGWPEK
jgi:metal-sulfur cluster biosynthetic enzyme